MVDMEASSGKTVGRTIRLGFVGVGDQGSYHLDVALGIPGVEVVALCDTDEGYLYRAKRWVEEAGQAPPRLYGPGPTDFKRLCGFRCVLFGHIQRHLALVGSLSGPTQPAGGISRFHQRQMTGEEAQDD
ncbi:MAG TPA: hypothetical protein GXX29_04970 [Firmicutes bacterium]|nr:hypothetical protein [Bacillota bacterium]